MATSVEPTVAAPRPPGSTRATGATGTTRVSRATRPTKPARAKPPRLVHERALWEAGHRIVAGVDEVGRGAWAGPLSVGVAVLGYVVPAGHRIPRGLRDSKLLTEDERERLFGPVGGWCAAWSVGHTSAAECDELGMTAALRMASARAFAALPDELVPDAVVLDGNFDFVSPPAAPDLFAPPHPLPGWAPTVRTVVRADRTCASVAAASVLAKVTRDRQMRDIAESFPAFDFDRNKGYPSPSHKVALRGYGLTALHRRSWAFVDHLPWGERFRRLGPDDVEGTSGPDGDVELDEWTDGLHRLDADTLGLESADDFGIGLADDFGLESADDVGLDSAGGGLLRQPEHAFADDVVEDLVGPAGDPHPRHAQHRL